MAGYLGLDMVAQLGNDPSALEQQQQQKLALYHMDMYQQQQKYYYRNTTIEILLKSRTQI